MRLQTSIVLVLLISYAFGQQVQTEPPVQFPVASTVKEFTKYGNIGTNDYKGLINFNIPIYTIKEDEVELPLVLNYYSGGVLVADNASWVGQNWSLNVPTAVQTIKGFNDFLVGTRFQKLPPYQGNPVDPGYGIFDDAFGYWNTNFGTQSLPGYQTIPYFTNVNDYLIVGHDGLYDINGSTYGTMFISRIVDTEPDIVNVTLNGVEIKFCRKDSNNNALGTMFPMQFDVINGRTEYKVEPILEPINQYISVNGFKITDPNGTVYEFVNLSEDRSIERQILYNLQRIITAKGKIINLQYQTIPFALDIGNVDATLYRRLGSTIEWKRNSGLIYDGDYKTFDDFSNVLFSPQNEDSKLLLNNTNSKLKLANHKILQAIISDSRVVNFYTSARQDAIYEKKLDSIVVRNSLNAIISKGTFEYSYFTSCTTTNRPITYESLALLDQEMQPISQISQATITDTNLKRLCLTAVSLSAEEKYEFQYYGGCLPAKTSNSIDYWGFYNGKNKIDLRPNLAVLGYPQYNDNNTNDFFADIDYCKIGSLKKVVYPTRGSTVFDYELHEFDSLSANPMPNATTINTGAGLRIKSIIDYSSVATIAKERYYTYSNGKCISKRVMTKESLERTGIECELDGNSPFKWETQVLSATTSNFSSSILELVGDYIGYDSVTEEVTVEGGNYRTTKTFANIPNTCILTLNTFYSAPYYISNRNNIENGSLLASQVFDINGNLVKENRYQYVNKSFEQNRYAMRLQSNGLRVMQAQLYDANATCSDYARERRTTLCTFYPIFDKTTLLAKETETTFYSSGNLAIETTYAYDSNNNIVGIEKKQLPNTNLSSTVKTYTYTSDANHLQKNALNLLKSETNLLGNSCISKTNYSYENVNNSICLKEVKEYPSCDEYQLNPRGMVVDLRDEKNNILQYHFSNGINVSIIYGYNKTLPVVKLENCAYSTIPTSLINSIQAASNSNDIAQLLNLYAGLLTQNSLNMAQITSFIHLPGVGVTTIIDPKGDKTFYEYDNAGRLVSVKDKEGNLLTKAEYNFKL